MNGGPMDALAYVAALPKEEIHRRAHAMYLRGAKPLAEQTLRDPYSVHGRGSTLEMELARTVLALIEEAERGN